MKTILFNLFERVVQAERKGEPLRITHEDTADTPELAEFREEVGRYLDKIDEAHRQRVAELQQTILQNVEENFVRSDVHSSDMQRLETEARERRRDLVIVAVTALCTILTIVIAAAPVLFFRVALALAIHRLF